MKSIITFSALCINFLIFAGYFLPAICQSFPLGDLFVNSDDEYSDYCDTSTKGSIPAFLQGSYVRVGPGLFQVFGKNFTHVFDGYGKLHKWEIMNEKVCLSSKFVNSSVYGDSLRTGAMTPMLTFTSPNPDFSTAQKLQALIRAKNNQMDNNNVNIVPLYSDLAVALTDTTVTISFQIQTLTTLGPTVYADNLTQEYPISLAHPQVHFPIDNYPNHNDINNNNDSTEMLYWNLLGKFALLPGSVNEYVLYKMLINPSIPFGNNELKRIPVGKFNLPHLFYLHSFIMASSFAVIICPPFYFDEYKISTLQPILNSNTWMTNQPVQIFIFDVSKQMNDTHLLDPILNIQTDPFFAFHTVNSFVLNGTNSINDDNNHPTIVFDLSAYEDSNVLGGPNCFGPIDLMKNSSYVANIPGSTIRRYQIDLSNGNINHKNVNDLDKDGIRRSIDLPIYNPNFQNKPYCYIYGIHTMTSDHKMNNDHSVDVDGWAVVKVNACSDNQPALYWTKQGHVLLEPAFVAPNNNKYQPNYEWPLEGKGEGEAAEDFGVLLISAYDSLIRSSYLLILNATDMTEISSTYPNKQVTIPFSIHGHWFN